MAVGGRPAPCACFRVFVMSVRRCAVFCGSCVFFRCGSGNFIDNRVCGQLRANVGRPKSQFL